MPGARARLGSGARLGKKSGEAALAGPRKLQKNKIIMSASRAPQSVQPMQVHNDSPPPPSLLAALILRSRKVHQAGPRLKPRHIRAQGSELLVEALVATVDVLDTPHKRLAVCC